jgi:hypothetical protein
MRRTPWAENPQPPAEYTRQARGRGLPLLLATIALLALPVILGGCGSSGSAGSDGDSTEHPTGKSDVVLQIFTGGGFVAVSYSLTQEPQFTLYGDGTVIVTGPMIAIYPQPALPKLQTTTISEEAIQAILSAAREAGLMANDFDYGRPGITDMPMTTIIVNADGTTYTSSIYALGMEQGAEGLSMEQQQARAAISQLSGQLTDLTAFETTEIKWETYAYSALAVYSTLVDTTNATATTEVQPNRLEWPLSDLSTSGEAVQPEGYRRVVVSGEDLAQLQPLLGKATEITLWTLGDREYHLYFRPLLPDETT